MKPINNIPIKTDSGEKANGHIVHFLAYLISYTFLIGIFIGGLAFATSMFNLLMGAMAK